MFTAEDIHELAISNNLISALRKILSYKTRKIFVIEDNTSMTASQIATQLGDNDVFVNNDEFEIDNEFYIFLNRYIEDRRYKIIDVSNNGKTINNVDIQEYIKSIDLCEKLARIYSVLESQCECVYIPG